MGAFQCPPDCGWCCTHLHREVGAAEARDIRAFRAILREQGVYHCLDGATSGLSLSNEEAARLAPRGAHLHPRTFLLDARRKLTVALDWHMPRRVCAYYEDHRCTAYEDRPLVCRAYPVLRAGPTGLAPECPEMPRPTSTLRVELRSRRAIDRAHDALDAITARVLDAPGLARGLPAREARARSRRWRVVPIESYAAPVA